MDSKIKQEMIDNHEACRILNETTAIIRPSAVLEKLHEKLSDTDIQIGADAVNKQTELNKIKIQLCQGCKQTSCLNKDRYVFHSLPNGNTNSDIVFVNKMPTEYEACNMCSHIDRHGVFLSMILSKLNISRDDVYCTDLIKCIENPDQSSCQECMRCYFEKEISLVKPKIIIFNGLAGIKACSAMNVITGLPQQITYGNIYNARMASGAEVKLTAIYDLDKVLEKQGTDYEKCKAELWAQLVAAIKAIQ